VSNLVFEVLLRLAKAGAALVVGAVVYGILVGPLGVTGSAELVLLLAEWRRLHPARREQPALSVIRPRRGSFDCPRERR